MDKLLYMTLGVGVMISVLTRLASMKRFKQIVGIIMIALALFAAFPMLNPMAITNPHTMSMHE